MTKTSQRYLVKKGENTEYIGIPQNREKSEIKEEVTEQYIQEKTFPRRRENSKRGAQGNTERTPVYMKKIWNMKVPNSYRYKI